MIRLEVSMQTQLVPLPIVISGPSLLPRFLGQRGLRREHQLHGGGESPRGLHLPTAHPPPPPTTGRGGSAPEQGEGARHTARAQNGRKGQKDSILT